MKRENSERVRYILNKLESLEDELERINESVENNILIQTENKYGNSSYYKISRSCTKILNHDFIIKMTKELIYSEIEKLNNELKTL